MYTLAMSTKSPTDKLVENEAMFRQKNETVQDDIKTLNEIALSQRDEEPISDDTVLNFYCECSDEDCRVRIPMSIKQYELIHKDRKQFIIVRNHEVSSIEDVMEQTSDYTVVRKLAEVPEEPDTLHQTPVFNI